MKKGIYALVLVLAVVVSGMLLANHEINNGAAKKPSPTAADKIAEKKKWEATPDGIFFTNWKASVTGKKVLAGAAKIRKEVNTSASMEAVVTSLSLPPGSRLGLGMMINIKGEDYILSFGLEEAKEFAPLRNLKVNDKIMIKSNAVTMAPKYACPIVKGDYVERDGKVLYKRAPNKGGC